MGSLPLEIVVFKKAAGLLNALDNDTRWEMLTLMHTQGPMTVTELYTHFILDQSHASFHLRILRNAGFVQTTRKWKYIYYSPHYENLEKAGTIISSFLNKGNPDYGQEFEDYIESTIPIFKPLPYKETYQGIQKWLASFSQQLNGFTLAITKKKSEMLKRAQKEGASDIEALRSTLEQSRKEGIKAFISRYKP